LAVKTGIPVGEPIFSSAMKKHTPFSRTIVLLIVFVSVLFDFSCSGPAKEQPDVAVDQAYEDLRLFVTEQDFTDIQGREGFEDTEYEQKRAQAAAEYERLQTRLNQYEGQLDETRRGEITELRARYDTLQARRERAYWAYVQSRDLRQDLLGVSTEREDLGTITADGIADRYQTFVDQVEKNREEFTPVDWNVVEGLWSALESRRQALEPELSRRDRNQIEQARQRYRKTRASLPAADPTGRVIQRGANPDQ
jgi:virulence-associated protein VapD